MSAFGLEARDSTSIKAHQRLAMIQRHLLQPDSVSVVAQRACAAICLDPSLHAQLEGRVQRLCCAGYANLDTWDAVRQTVDPGSKPNNFAGIVFNRMNEAERQAIKGINSIGVNEEGESLLKQWEKLMTLSPEIRAQITSLHLNVGEMDPFTLHLYFMAFPKVEELHMNGAIFGKDLLKILNNHTSLKKANLRGQSWQAFAQVRIDLAITWNNYVNSP